ncbi:MAG: hypothetical protein Q4F70_02105 [Clostridia bacterium]|nr:hypothetical protein [Clostridia bacterium]
MKKIISALLMVLVLVSCISPMAFAAKKSYAAIVSESLSNPAVLASFDKLVDAVATDDGEEILKCVLEIYPDWVKTIKDYMDKEGYTEKDPDFSGLKNANVIEAMYKNTLLFRDFAKLTEAVEIGDDAKILECVLEIYPDFIDIAKNAESSTGAGSTFSDSNNQTTYIIVAGLAGIVVGAGITLLAVKKKKKSE